MGTRRRAVSLLEPIPNRQFFVLDARRSARCQADRMALLLTVLRRFAEERSLRGQLQRKLRGWPGSHPQRVRRYLSRTLRGGMGNQRLDAADEHLFRHYKQSTAIGVVGDSIAERFGPSRRYRG